MAERAIDPRQIILSVGFTIASYIALTFYDVIALRVIGTDSPSATSSTTAPTAR
jgi:phosphatidylglycerol lysyltransferase